MDEYLRLRENCRLFTVSFPSRKLGLTLVLGRLSGSARPRLLVDETLDSCVAWDVLRPCACLV